MLLQKDYKFWFCTGSQDLYGDACLANDAALAYTGENGPGGNEWANQALFDYDGNMLPALEVIRDF